ncbi:hypothetical protein GCM10007853_30130 [Algimonas ampicilliniresistens]|uniref:Uncharacterized protein n=1 Tax=Algimonas ampicilliniresistens TaxID=1298735 RepID=A0ABQ5VEN8_9PROT|nr:hypothetical protein [Algimonas ampicilliniresistens]GLQ25139.1 hypothetical protein GCM10007853_30130 [Algimonas ampicilliniresistens]
MADNLEKFIRDTAKLLSASDAVGYSKLEIDLTIKILEGDLSELSAILQSDPARVPNGVLYLLGQLMDEKSGSDVFLKLVDAKKPYTLPKAAKHRAANSEAAAIFGHYMDLRLIGKVSSEEAIKLLWAKFPTSERNFRRKIRRGRGVVLKQIETLSPEVQDILKSDFGM